MSCFLLPDNLCLDIEQILCDYWWGNASNSKKTHWLRWKRMCKPKYLDGIGFRDLGMFNFGHLAKQGWRILKDPSSLVARLLKAKYFPRGEFIDAPDGKSPSYTWRSICAGREVLKQGLRWRWVMETIS
ncbi:uncharacterized protein [Phyllobates terribilis]|uniref:uncharacterized protein n=1 Tax=Phyllobates terribilis TaxID=111132 RepID=UPI003CCA8E37